jgi:hypothetical protein
MKKMMTKKWALLNVTALIDKVHLINSMRLINFFSNPNKELKESLQMKPLALSNLGASF